MSALVAQGEVTVRPLPRSNAVAVATAEFDRLVVRWKAILSGEKRLGFRAAFGRAADVSNYILQCLDLGEPFHNTGGKFDRIAGVLEQCEAGTFSFPVPRFGARKGSVRTPGGWKLAWKKKRAAKRAVQA